MLGRRQGVSLIALAIAVAVSACGGGNSGSSSGEGGEPRGPAKRGGTLVALAASDVDSIDPGVTYTDTGIALSYATHRPLFSPKPGSAEPVPDLAAGPPEVSPDGRTVTIRIRPGVRFSPPVNREVTSKDVKYALTRIWNPALANAYAAAYLSDLEGLEAFQEGRAKEISGLQTPDDQTLIIRLTTPSAATVIGVLSLPGSAPVPADYAAKFDAHDPPDYATHQVTTGPYMYESDSSGNVTGYKPGRLIEIVRNPNWDAKTDFRPAYLDRIQYRQGNEDLSVATRKVLAATNTVAADFGPPSDQIRKVLEKHRSQLQLVPVRAVDYVTLNTTVAPLDDLNVRKAILAAYDRVTVRKLRGGPTKGAIATHFLPPGMPGFEQAGGKKGPGVDFLANPNGDRQLAAEYMKKAGYPSGRYDGGKKVLLIIADDSESAKVGQHVKATLEALGIGVDLKAVTFEAAVTKYCVVPEANVGVCAAAGWFADFGDPQTMLDPIFNGNNITPSANNNYSELDVPEINDAMERAKALRDPAKRAEAWAQIDRMVVEQAPAIPSLWPVNNLLASAGVRGVANEGSGRWDYAFTSLK